MANICYIGRKIHISRPSNSNDMKFRVENTSRFIMLNEINQDKEQLY